MVDTDDHWSNIVLVSVDSPPTTARCRKDRGVRLALGYQYDGTWRRSIARRHRDIRNMVTNQKHVLGSIAVNYEMSLQIQMEWRLEEGVSWSVPAEGRSTFAGARPVPEATRVLRPGTPRVVYIDHL